MPPPSARVAIDSHKWLAAKFYPKQFGEQQTFSVGHNISKDYVAQPCPLQTQGHPPKPELFGRVMGESALVLPNTRS